MAYTFRFVIPDGSSSVLLIEDRTGWALPRTRSAEPEIVVEVAPTLRDVVASDVIVLRDIRIGPMPPPDDSIVYLTEPLPDRSVAQGRWWKLDDGLDLVDPRDRAAIEAWLREDEPASLQPWQREGWFASAAAWISEILPGVSEIRQFATWCNSCILRVRSDAGRTWFKAAPRYFATEPVVMAMLAELLPGRTPEVLALDTDRGWMLLEDLGDNPVDALSVGERLEALIAVGELHRASLTLTDALLHGGCLDRRPHPLSTQIAALAEDPAVPMPVDLRARLQAAVPRLQELCARLASSPIPPTLVHGDLHAGNIMRTASGRFVVFDWSDACIADPFVDLLMFLARLPEDPNLRAAFRERYLGAWPRVTLADAAAYTDFAEPLAAMHHAITYRGIYDAFGDYEWWLFEGALPRWIEHALACPIVAA